MRFHSKLVLAGLVALAVVAASCATVPPFRIYDGEAKSPGAVALVSFVNPSFISIVPYKVDGRPSAVNQPGAAPDFGTYLSFTTLNTDFEFLPGEHSIEFFAVNADPVDHFVVRFAVEAGRAYVLKGKSRALTLTSNGTDIPFTIEPVPILEEPKAMEPHATLTFIPGTGGFSVAPYLLRIDGRVREHMYRLHPRWTTMNYSGLARGVVTSISGAGMLVQPNVEAGEGYFSVRLAPGEHRIEYMAETLYLGRRSFGRLVREIDFVAEEGRDYRIEIVPDLEKSPSGVIENGIRIVAK